MNKSNWKLDPVIDLINKTGGEFTINDIVDRMDVSRFTVGRAIDILLEKNNIEHVRGGRPKVYRNVNDIPEPTVVSSDPVHVEPTEDSDKKIPSHYDHKDIPVIPPDQLIPVKDQFKMIEHITGMVLDGIAPSFLLTGMAGVGKTYAVRQEVLARDLQKDIDYQWLSGCASPLGLFRVLHDNRDGIVIFDDCDDVLKKPGSINILKSALDLYKTRVISWPSKTVADAGMDEHFEFTGQVIFISNLQFARIADALTSRAFKVDVHLTPDQVIEKIYMIIEDITPNGQVMPLEYKMDALEAFVDLKDEIIGLGKNIDIRAFEKACLLRQSVGDSGAWNDVKKMVKYQI